jgi:hypothetical protein
MTLPKTCHINSLFSLFHFSLFSLYEGSLLVNEGSLLVYEGSLLVYEGSLLLYLSSLSFPPLSLSLRHRDVYWQWSEKWSLWKTVGGRRSAKSLSSLLSFLPLSFHCLKFPLSLLSLFHLSLFSFICLSSLYLFFFSSLPEMCLLLILSLLSFVSLH